MVESNEPVSSDNSDIVTLTFEQALKQLETIVINLERGDVALEESIRIYERGELLKNHCDRLLKAAEHKVEVIRLNREGAAIVAPLDSDDTPF